MNTRASSGFTVLELMVALVVAGVILGVGVPNLMEFQRNNAIASASNDFVTAVLAARAEAVKRGVPVTLCATSDPTAPTPTCTLDGSGTNGGFFVWVEWDGTTDPDTESPVLVPPDGVVDAGETVLRRIEAPGGAIDVFMNSGYITYGPNGFARNPIGGTPVMSQLLYCDDRGRGTAAGGFSAARVIQVQPTGRAEVMRANDQVENGIGIIEGAGVTVNCP